MQERHQFACQPDVDVYFQQNHWADTEFCVEWVKRTLSPAVKESEIFVLFCDNVSAQVSDDFKKKVSDLRGAFVGMAYKLQQISDYLWTHVMRSC